MKIILTLLLITLVAITALFMYLNEKEYDH